MKRILKAIKNRLPESALERLRGVQALLRGVPYRKPGACHCHCCGRSFVGYMPIGKRIDTDVLFAANTGKAHVAHSICPYCRSLPRHRAEARLIAGWLDAGTTPQRVLAFAPEKAVLAYLHKLGLRPVTADLIADNVDIHVDIEDTKLPKNSFDLIICNHVLEHVHNCGKALAELHRILAPGGVLLCTVPMDYNREHTLEDASARSAAQRLKTFGQADHVRLFGKDIIPLLASVFDMEIFDGSRTDPVNIPLVGPSALDYNLVFVCRKTKQPPVRGHT